MLTLLSGLGLMFSLIIAVGAQNVFVLRQGLRREHVLPVVLICAASDALLVLAGTAGLGYLIGQLPWLLVAARWLGGISLVVYGIYAVRRAWGSNGESLVADASPAADADFVCFEPVTHPVDAFNLPGEPRDHGLKVLEPGESLGVSMRITVHPV